MGRRGWWPVSARFAQGVRGGPARGEGLSALRGRPGAIEAARGAPLCAQRRSLRPAPTLLPPLLVGLPPASAPGTPSGQQLRRRGPQPCEGQSLSAPLVVPASGTSGERAARGRPPLPLLSGNGGAALAQARAPRHSRGLGPSLRVKRAFFLNETAPFVGLFVGAAPPRKSHRRGPGPQPRRWPPRTRRPAPRRARPCPAAAASPARAGLFLTLRETPNAHRKRQDRHPPASSGVVVDAGFPTTRRFSRPGSGAGRRTGLLNLRGFSGGRARAPRHGRNRNPRPARILAPRCSYLGIPFIQSHLNSLSSDTWARCSLGIPGVCRPPGPEESNPRLLSTWWRVGSPSNGKGYRRRRLGRDLLASCPSFGLLLGLLIATGKRERSGLGHGGQAAWTRGPTGSIC